MTNNQNRQIDELNTIIKATLGRSEIHGIGVIALRDIRKGEKIYADKLPEIYTITYSQFGKLFPEARKVILERWPNIIHGERFIYPDARLVSFMNHSYEPNYDPYTDTALRKIKLGDEITENYCIVKDAEKIYPWLNFGKYGIMKEEISWFQNILNILKKFKT